MSITQLDLKYFHALEVSDATTNGGGIDLSNEAITGVKNNVWPNVSASQRESGLVTYRKLFCTPASDTNDPLVDPRAWNHSPTPGDDYVLLFAGTKSDTQATIDESRIYGSSNLKSDVSIGDTSIIVTVENSDLTGIFQAGDKIIISNQSSPDGTGDFQEIELDSTPPTVSGLDITLYLAASIEINFSSTNTVVSSVYYPGTTECSVGTINVTSSAGSTDESSFSPVLNNAGTTDEILTFTWSTSTEFTVEGSVSGELESGNISLDYTATNPINGYDLITLPAGFFSGTWAPLDTCTIQVIGNNFAIWLKRVVPAGSGTLSADVNITAFKGESA